MFRNTHKLSKLSAAALAVVALAVPATSAANTVDFRNPDTKEPAIGSQRGYQDLRSADTEAAGIEAQRVDSGRVTQPAQSPQVVESPDFDWGDAGIGAGSVLGLLLITLSVMFGVVHRRNRAVAT